MKRLYNTHPDRAFVVRYNSQNILFQPVKGEWRLATEVAKGGRRGEKARITTKLEKVSDRKMRNWAEVSEDLAHKILTRNPAGFNDQGEIDDTHHGGFIKEQGKLEELLENELSETVAEIAAKKQRMAEIDEELARKQKLLDELDLTGGAPSPGGKLAPPQPKESKKA